VVPDGVQLSALRRKTDGRVELRVVEVEGQRHEAALTLGFRAAAAAETNLLGSKVADAPLKHGTLRTTVVPWKIRTFALG
jgi:alpha-mannosidase